MRNLRETNEGKGGLEVQYSTVHHSAFMIPTVDPVGQLRAIYVLRNRGVRTPSSRDARQDPSPIGGTLRLNNECHRSCVLFWFLPSLSHAHAADRVGVELRSSSSGQNHVTPGG